MGNLTTFNFGDVSDIRVIEKNGEAWFVASDIAKALDYRDASNMNRNLDDDEKGTQNVSTLGGTQEVTVINESGLYVAILKSRKPEAKRFKKWVVGTVLPAIRKTGGYIQGEEHIESEDELVLRAMQVLERKVAAMKPKADYHDKWMSSKGSFTTTDIAKQLGISAIKLNNFMREQGIKWKRKDLPISGYEHWFKVIDVVYDGSFSGEVGIKKQCRITPEGARSIVGLWERKGGWQAAMEPE